MGVLVGVLSLLVIANCEVVGVFQVSRHGARSPIEQHEWSPARWAEGLGELTKHGRSQSYLVGSEVRDLYIVKSRVTSQNFNLSEVHVRSTDYPRTIMSAQALLMGLFPKGPKVSKAMAEKAVPPFPMENLKTLIEKLGDYALPNGTQPVPVEIVPIFEDNLLLGYSDACPRMKEIVTQVQHSSEYHDRVLNYTSELMPRLTEIFGKVMFMEEAAWAADTIYTSLFHGLPIPEGFDNSTLDAMSEVLSYCNSYIFERGGAYLASSEFYKEMIITFKALKHGKSTRKWSIFVAHDTTIIGILKALEVWDGKNPEFASTVVFELDKKEGELYVKLWYNGNFIPIGDCGVECPFEEFGEILEAWLIPDIHEACKIDYGRAIHKELILNPFFETRT